MTGNDHVTYNVAEKRYEMPFGHLMVYANVRKDNEQAVYRLRVRAAGVARYGSGWAVYDAINGCGAHRKPEGGAHLRLCLQLASAA